MGSLVIWLTKLLCHWTGLEYNTGSSKTGVSCNEKGFNWKKGETMKVILYMYDYVKIRPCKIIVVKYLLLIIGITPSNSSH